jgi:hypothetical protein
MTSLVTRHDREDPAPQAAAAAIEQAGRAAGRSMACPLAACPFRRHRRARALGLRRLAVVSCVAALGARGRRRLSLEELAGPR